MTNIRPLSELSAIPKKAYFPIDQIGEVEKRFGVLPHEEALRSGVKIETNSTKELWVVNLNDAGQGRRNFAVKIYQGLTPQAQQSVIYELDGRVIANSLQQVIASTIKGLEAPSHTIFTPPAIGYENKESVVLVTDFVDGASHLDTDLTKSLSPEVRAMGIQIPLLTGVRQFYTSSFLCRGKTDQNTGDQYLEVALIDLESIGRERELDHNTTFLFHMLKSACQGDSAVRFTDTLQNCGNTWYEAISDESNRAHLAYLIRAIRGGVTIQDSMSPDEMVENTLAVAEHYRNLGFVLKDDETSTTTPNILEIGDRFSSVFDKDFCLRQLAGDHLLMGELMEISSTESGRRLSNLKRAIQARDFKNIRYEAHTIKGMLINFTDRVKQTTASIAQHHAIRIEKMSLGSQLADEEGNIDDAYNILNTQLNEVINAFKQILGKS